MAYAMCLRRLNLVSLAPSPLNNNNNTLKRRFLNVENKISIKIPSPLPFAFEKKLARMSAAHCVCLFFSFRRKNERASNRTEDRLLNVNYLHGLHGR